MQTSFSQQFDTYDDQLPVPSTSPGHPEIPYALNLQLEQYRDKDTYTDGAAFFKKWALGMLVLDNNLKNEGLSTTELCAAADAAAEKYNVSKLLPMQVGKQIREAFSGLPKQNKKRGSKGKQLEYYEKLVFRASAPAPASSISSFSTSGMGSPPSMDNSSRSSMSPFSIASPPQQTAYYQSAGSPFLDDPSFDADAALASLTAKNAFDFSM